MRIQLRIRAIATLLGFCFGALALPGCAPQQKPEDGKITIGAIIFQEDQFFRMVEFGLRDAAEKQDVTLMINISGTLDKEISLVDTYLANRVDALVVSPLSAQSSIPALKRAYDMGIPVVTFDSSVDADFPASTVRSDQVELGRMTGEAARAFIENTLGGKARIAMVEYISNLPEPGGQRVKGFKDEVTKLPGVEIVTEQDAWMAPEATALVENILTANPDIDLVWAANEGGTVGAVNAVTAANKKNPNHHIYVFGTDMSEQIGGFLLSDENVLQAVTAQKPFDIGSEALAAAVKSLHNEPVEKSVSMPGILFSRADPGAIDAYMKTLKELAQ